MYKARDTRLDRTVAIKVLPEHIAKREDLRAPRYRQPGWRWLHGNGVHGGPDACGAYLEGRIAARSGSQVHHPDRRCAGPRAPRRRHPSRREAAEHHVDARWREGAGFRIGQIDTEAQPHRGPNPFFEASAPVPLFDAHMVHQGADVNPEYDVTADGKRFLINTIAGSGGGTDTENRPLVLSHAR